MPPRLNTIQTLTTVAILAHGVYVCLLFHNYTTVATMGVRGRLIDEQKDGEGGSGGRGATGGAPSKAAVPLENFPGISVFQNPQPTTWNDDASSVGAPPPAKKACPPPAKALNVVVPPLPPDAPWANWQGPPAGTAPW